jgi:hypothetical protein
VLDGMRCGNAESLLQGIAQLAQSLRLLDEARDPVLSEAELGRGLGALIRRSWPAAASAALARALDKGGSRTKLE